MRTYYVSMDVLQPWSDQGTASQMVTSGGPFSTGMMMMMTTMMMMMMMMMMIITSGLWAYCVCEVYKQVKRLALPNHVYHACRYRSRWRDPSLFQYRYISLIL